MKQSCVRAFARAVRTGALAAAALGISASALFAQATGKIEGTVRDEAGAPIANAQVSIVGSAYSALTNPQGYYFINNVPSGVHSMRAAFIGYRAVRTDGVRVLGGQTVTNDFQLTASVVVLEEITIETTQPLVPRDEVTTKQRISGEFTDNLPVDRLNQVLTLQPGVVANSSGTSLSIRGGRPDEAATYVDGVPVDPGNRGTVNAGVGSIGISTNSFEEASITTGASSAEFGNAQSGIINIASKTGSNTRFSGGLSWETDEPFPNTMSRGYNRIGASIGGPTKIVPNLTFYLSGAIEGNRYGFSGTGTQAYPTFQYAGIDTVVKVPTSPGSATSDTSVVNVYNLAVSRGDCDLFANSTNPEIANNYGVDCNGARNARNAASNYGLQGKLSYSFGSGSRVSLLGLASQNQARGGITLNTNPSNIGANRGWNQVVTFNWLQNLTKSSERALALDASVSYQLDRFVAGPMTPASELSTRDNFGGFMVSPLDFLFDFESFPLDSALIDNFKNNRKTARLEPYDILNVDQYNTVNKFRNDGYATLGSSESGGPTGGITLSRERRLLAKGAVDWQFDRFNRLKFGGEHTWYDSRYYNHGLTSQAFANGYFQKPIRWNAFLEDRLDLGDVVVVGGLRYDVYNSRAERPYALDTISTLGSGAPNPTYGTYQQFPRISSYTDEDGVATVNGQTLPLVGFIPDERHDYLSPHVQVAFPVTDRTNFRLSYAHQVQAPDFGVLFAGINTDLSTTNTNNVYGRDLDFGRSITFEFGVRHAFSSDMVLDVAAYNKDKLSDATARLVSRRDPTRANASVDIREYTNFDFGNSRGIDVRLDRRIGNLFNGTVSYSYSSAKNTGDDPNTYLNFGSRVVNAVSGGNQPPPQAITPLINSRPHNLAGAFSVNFPGDYREGTVLGTLLQDFGMFGTFRFASGFAYTRCRAFGNESTKSGQGCGQAGYEGGLNTSRLPTFKQVDLRFTKGFGLGGLDLTAYLDVRNILNFRNTLQVFVLTNDVVNSVDRDQDVASTIDSWTREAERNEILTPSGDIDLRFGTAGNSGCANYVTTQGDGAVPSCIYLIRAEERFGNGDHLLTTDEQRRIADLQYDLGEGSENFLGDGRRMRLGFEINF